MTKEGFQKLCADSKKPLTLNQAADRIHALTLPMMSKSILRDRSEYVARLAQRTACQELERLIRNASPWEDYREIVGAYIWPYIHRIARHLYNRLYEGPDGKRWLKADAWVVELLRATYCIFDQMPGGEIPDIRPWKMFQGVVNEALHKTKHYRRNY